ncbi:hypothetical protein E8E14_002057 [Neopestalotiopsis sp. 37M]|nr:hypothetical protein E8E14_002057 [Neopestalotiopsis sp. 37M]
MSSAFARSLPSSLSARTLFIKCSPAPSSFAERRAILKALSTTGTGTGTKIEVFKKLEDSSSFIAVTTTPESAQSLVGDSPYERIVHLQEAAHASLFSTAAWGASFRTTITDPVNVQPAEDWRREGSNPGWLLKKNRETQMDERERTSQSEKITGMGDTTAATSMGLSSKTFTIRVFPANASFSHKRAVELNPLHGPWPRNDGYDTFVSLALKKSVPGSRMSPGLRDWDTGRQLSPDPLGYEDEGAESLLGGRSRRSYFIEKRRRKAETEVPDVMQSLAAVAKSSTATKSSKESGNEQPGKSQWNRSNSHDVIKDTPISPTDFHDLFKGT